MNKAQQERLEKNGWKVGTVAEFLNLTPEEEAFVELKFALSQLLQSKRKQLGMTQTQLAEKIDSSQSRIAKVEKAEKSVSFDLIIKSLIALGVRENDIARAIMKK